MSTLLAIAIFIVAVCVIYIAVASRRHKQGARGEVNLVGQTGTVERDLRPDGAVLVAGEVWPARTRPGRTITRAECPRVRVVGTEGYWLEVEPEE
ncbi:MAG TPA: NfeD family protein [Pyrinomonadaceae bacterium]|nr:NfeD family protein [Pyrinomonadaceae bacterium]